MQTSNQAGHIDAEDTAVSVESDTSSVQTSIAVTRDLERCLTVVVPAEKIDSRVKERIEETVQTVKLNGFRKGRAPLKLIRKRFGAGLRQEVLTDIINETFQQSIKAESLNPVSRPEISLEESGEGKDLQYTAVFEIYPSITLVDFAEIEITTLYAEIEEADIDEMIQKILKQEAFYKPVERAAAIDDKVTINYLGAIDGKPFDGGKADEQWLVLGSGSMVPGFEESIVGMSVDEEKIVSLRLPDDYHAEELKGADVEFTIELKQVAEQVIPQLDEQFLAKYGVDDGDVVKFRADIRSNMQRELDAAAKTYLKTQTVDTLVDTHKPELPKALVASEIEALRQQMGAQFQSEATGGDIDLKNIFPDDSLSDKAEHRVASSLLLSEIAKSNNISVNQERVLSVIKTLAESYEKPEELVNYYYQNPHLLDKVQSSVLEDQVIEIILKKANVENKKVGYFELVKH